MYRDDFWRRNVFGKRKNLLEGSCISNSQINQLYSGVLLPLLVNKTPDCNGITSWIEKNRSVVDEKIQKNGAILFRGFNIDSSEKFEQVIETFSAKPLLSYEFRSTPRKSVGRNVYTSTEYPSDQYIPIHSEFSYTRHWPSHIYFCCLKAATYKGYTPIADNREVYALIPKDIREEFEAKGVRYLRNYGDMDLSVEEVFGSIDKQQVENICEKYGILFQWKGDHLNTWQDCQATTEHPGSGEKLWFNQAHLFHVSSRGEEIMEALISEFGMNSLPRHATFSDGGEIPLAYLDVIRDCYKKSSIEFPWQEGDVLILDNMLIGHGRSDFEGDRKVIVGMTA